MVSKEEIIKSLEQTIKDVESMPTEEFKRKWLEVGMTNEEWLHTLTTEEKAKWFADNFGFVAYKASGGNPKRVQEDLVEYWQEWLKQPHTQVPKKQEKRK